MPYAVFPGGTVSNALASVAEFARTTMEWTVTEDAAGVHLEFPGKPAKFSLSAGSFSGGNSSYGYYDYEYLKIGVSQVQTPWESLARPLTPLSNVYVFAGNTPEPWMHLVFTTIPGVFVHAWLGYGSKLGNYSGGALVGTTYWTLSAGTPDEWDDADSHMLFAGSGRYSGGIEINHEDAPSSVYYFGSNNLPAVFRAGGGWGDAYNTALSAVSPTGVDGSTTLHPILLFAALPGGSDTWVTPVAYVPGIRSIKADIFGEGQVITVGGLEWQVFPMGSTRYAYGESIPVEEGLGGVYPSSDGNMRYQYRMGTEWLGIAILRE